MQILIPIFSNLLGIFGFYWLTKWVGYTFLFNGSGFLLVLVGAASSNQIRPQLLKHCRMTDKITASGYLNLN